MRVRFDELAGVTGVIVQEVVLHFVDVLEPQLAVGALVSVEWIVHAGTPLACRQWSPAGVLPTVYDSACADVTRVSASCGDNSGHAAYRYLDTTPFRIGIGPARHQAPQACQRTQQHSTNSPPKPCPKPPTGVAG